MRKDLFQCIKLQIKMDSVSFLRKFSKLIKYKAVELPRLCERCGKRPAAVPDPERMGRPIRRICSECHAGGLRAGFLLSLSLQQEERRRREHEKGQEPRDSCP